MIATMLYIFLRGDIVVVVDNWTLVAFKNYAPFTKSIIKVDRATINNAGNLDLVMLMYNLLKYSLNCFEITGSWWFHSRDEATSFNADIRNNEAFKSLNY